MLNKTGKYMNLNKVFQPRPEDVQERWVVVDAKNKRVGRLSTEIASKILGKDNVFRMPHVKTGVRVIVVNSDQVIMTGNKMEKKEYWHVTGYTGNKKNYFAKDLYKKDSTEIIYRAVKGMLSKSKMGRQLLDSHLKIYAGENHPHQAQI